MPPRRPSDVPAPSLAALRGKNPHAAAQLMTAARKVNRDPADFLADLVWLGWQAQQAQGKH